MSIESGDEVIPQQPVVAVRGVKRSFEEKYGGPRWLVKGAIFCAVLLGVGLGTQLNGIRHFIHELTKPPPEVRQNVPDGCVDDRVSECFPGEAKSCRISTLTTDAVPLFVVNAGTGGCASGASK